MVLKLFNFLTENVKEFKVFLSRVNFCAQELFYGMKLFALRVLISCTE